MFSNFPKLYKNNIWHPNIFILYFLKKPSLVVGFGGYTSVPTLIAAKLLNVKILLHEQNSVMGRTIEFYQNFRKSCNYFSKNKIR